MKDLIFMPLSAICPNCIFQVNVSIEALDDEEITLPKKLITSKCVELHIQNVWNYSISVFNFQLKFPQDEDIPLRKPISSSLNIRQKERI